MRRSISVSLVLAAILCLGGCGAVPDGRGSEGSANAVLAGESISQPSSGSAGGSASGTSSEPAGDDASQTLSGWEKQDENHIPTSSYSAQGNGQEDFVPYQAPEFADSAFHEEHAEGSERVKIDTEHVSLGYVAVSAQSDTRLKFQVLKDGAKYNYDIASDGTPSIFPLQSGDGTYAFKVMENIKDMDYAPLYKTECQVTLEDEFQPFLRPSDYSRYGEDSECVKKGRELAGKVETALEYVSAVFDYVCGNITYDREKAQAVQEKSLTVYLPDPDETLRTGKGICFDYASLVAALLRSQGIPAKLVFGYVSPDNLYHAWNMFYTEETGWVTVHYEVKAGEWNRLDLTFSANGADGSFIGDGTNYADVYYY